MISTLATRGRGPWTVVYRETFATLREARRREAEIKFRATGITAYLKNGGTLENAAAMANHASTRTTQLYDRRHDEISLDEVERIRL